MRSFGKLAVAIVVAVATMSCDFVSREDSRQVARARGGLKQTKGSTSQTMPPLYMNFSLGMGGVAWSVAMDVYAGSGGIVGGVGFASLGSPNPPPGFYDWTCPHSNVTYLGQFITGEFEMYALFGVKLRPTVLLVGTLGLSMVSAVELEQSNTTGWTYLAYWTSGGVDVPGPYATVGAEVRFVIPDTAGMALVSIGLHSRRGLTLGGGYHF